MSGIMGDTARGDIRRLNGAALRPMHPSFDYETTMEQLTPQGSITLRGLAFVPGDVTDYTFQLTIQDIKQDVQLLPEERLLRQG